MFDVVRYTPDRAGEWNAFVARSKNGTFLFDRRYMDYHQERFSDCSLMLFRRGRLFALLPGNRVADVFYSHQGLTYGGLVTDSQVSAAHVCDALVAVNAFLRRLGICRVVYKPVPWIYHTYPAEEDLFALSLRCGARLIERDASSVVFLRQPLSFSESRRSGLRKAERSGVTIAESDDLSAFWQILETNLLARYGAHPVHSLSEIQLLRQRFPQQIRLVMASLNGTPLAGTLLYLTPQVVRTQYISASPEGKRLGALDLLFHHLLHEHHFSQPYFDFGTSASEHSNELNASLIFQKQGFGGRCVCYDWYAYDL